MYAPALLAIEDWGQCAIPVIKKQSKLNNTTEQPIQVTAKWLDINQRDSLKFTGNVIFEQQPDTHIQSEELFFNKNNKTILSNTPSIFTFENSLINSQNLSFNGQTKSGIFNNISLQSLDTHRFSTADQLIQINEHEQQLNNFHYTSCEPNDIAWELVSSSLQLNHNIGLGIAKHAKIYLFDIPIFYFPYFQFPIDDKRHSGLLMPSFTLSDSNGHSLSVPVYWNIHPQVDTTIEFNYNNERGLQLNSESRYLTLNTKGSLTTSSLNDNKENIKRYFYRLNQSTILSENINLDLDMQTVSEQAFFNDFKLISLAKVPDYLERHLSINHTSSRWNTTLLLQNYQILDESISITSRPYEQWPKITSVGQFRPFNDSTTLDINHSFINFRKDNSVTTERYGFNPIISKKWFNSYSFIKPELSYSFSEYHLNNTDNSHNTIKRSLATLSIDSGLFFERIASEENGWLQTLEPRLFYLNTPYKDQSDIPIFDTSDLSLNYANLFKNNRFNGGDRIGDAKQFTFGLSSRLLDINSGLELFRLSLGQTFFKQDRLVQLTGTSVSEESTSDLFLEIASQPQKHWSISSSITQQAESNFLTQKVLSISRQQNDHILNVSYRFKGTESSTELEQTDISMVYPINQQWKLFIKKQYSLIDHQNVEQLIGTSYDSCCWSFSILLQESADDDFDVFDRSIYFQFTLKGLSSLGRDNNSLLTQSIPGYH